MASGVNPSVRPSASARSTAAASFSAVAETFSTVPGADFVSGGVEAFLAFVRLADSGASLGFVATLAAAVLRTDINLVPFLDHFVLAQLELAVGDAFAGLDVVLIAVPGAHKVEFGVGEIQALRGLIGHDALFDFGDGQPLARRSALMQAVVAVGIKGAVFPEHADLMVADEHDTTVAILELGNLADEFLNHSKYSLPVGLGGPVDASPCWFGREAQHIEYAFIVQSAPRLPIACGPDEGWPK